MALLANAEFAANFLDGGGTVFNAKHPTYGCVGDGATDDKTPARALIDAVMLTDTNSGEAVFSPGNYKLTGNPFYNRIVAGTNTPMTVRLNGAKWTTTKQIKLPPNTIIRGSGRIRCGIVADASFIRAVTITTIDLVSNVVTVVTGSAHGLEIGATVVIQGVVTATGLNVGAQVTTVPTASSFTFAFTAANVSDTTGTVYIPLVVLGSWVGGSGTRLENLSVDAQDLSNSVGIYSNSLQEIGGGSHLLVTGAAKYGIWMERHGQLSTGSTAGPNNYHFYHCEVNVTPNVAATGVYVRGTFGLDRGFDNITTNTNTNAGTSTAGFDVSGFNGTISNIHCEHATDGILWGNRGLSSSAATNRDSAGAVISNIGGITGTITNLVHLKNYGEVSNVVLLGLKRAGATNVLVDDIGSITLTEDYLGFYAIGGIPTSTRISSSPNVPWILAPVATFSAGSVDGGNAVAALIQHVINTAAGQTRQLSFQTAGVLRWALRCDSTAESGGDAGSLLQILARTDAGAAIDVPLQVARAAGSALQWARPLQMLTGSYLQHSVSSPAQITSNQNDYALASASHFRLTTDASRDITGFTTVATGREIKISNVGSFNIVLKNQNAGSTATNRIITGNAGDLTIQPDYSVTLVYDATTGRWRVTGKNF